MIPHRALFAPPPIDFSVVATLADEPALHQRPGGPPDVAPTADATVARVITHERAKSDFDNVNIQARGTR
jgi:hypothetical protein